MSRNIIPEAVAREPWHVILPLFALNTFGSVVLHSAAGGHLSPWALLHTIHFVVFLAMAFVISRLPREFFKAIAYPAYGVLVALLVMVDLFGAVRGGSQRWINLGFMQLQPSELMKPGIVLTLAYFFDSLPPAMTRNWRALLPAAALIAVPALLVIIQPDLGSAMTLAAGVLGVLIIAGTQRRHFIGVTIMGIATFAASIWSTKSKSSCLTPWSDGRARCAQAAYLFDQSV